MEKMRARVLMCWWAVGDRVVLNRGGIESGAVVAQKPSYHGNASLWLTGDDGEVIEVTTKRLTSEEFRIRMENPMGRKPAKTASQRVPQEPGRLSPIDSEPWEIDPRTLMGDGEFRGESNAESLLHDNRIRAASGLRALREHGSSADNVDQALADVLVDLLHLGDLLCADPGWLDDAREHYRKEITGDY